MRSTKVAYAGPVTPEHARHVIEIIEAAYLAADTGQTQDLRTAFELPA